MISIKEILKLNVAISESQAIKVKNKINFKSKHIILDFEGITDVTTAFFNVIIDGFYGILKSANELNDVLEIRNYNEAVEFAFGDSYKLFEQRYE